MNTIAFSPARMVARARLRPDSLGCDAEGRMGQGRTHGGTDRDARMGTEFGTRVVWPIRQHHKKNDRVSQQAGVTLTP